MTSSEWRTVKLKDLTIKIGSGVTPRGGSKVYLESGIPLIRSQNIYNCEFSIDGIVYIDEVTAKKMENVRLIENDILLNITGDSVARCTILPNSFIGARVNQHVAIIRTIEDQLIPAYLKYWLVNNPTQEYLLSIARTGGTRAALTKAMIETLEITLPPLLEQKAIAHILSTLDEKIEVNNIINKTLEEMAQALFKRWFVDFEFPNEDGEPYKSSGGEMIDSELGPIPKGWEVGSVGDYMRVKSGFAFKSKWWKESGVPVIKIKNLSNGIVDYSDVGYVEVDKIEAAKDFIVKSGDILIAMTGATIGKIGLVYEFNNTILVNQRVGKFFIGENPFEKLPFAFTILTNSRINDEIISLGGGSAQPNISPSQIESIKIAMPISNQVEIFNSLLNPVMRIYVDNIKENAKLQQLRDTLLPKLMSGEIRVPLDIEEQ